ncbi:uncharacterized protein LOC119373675 [Rhipicephalus sanguineus]|uniref:uncharacterized protein LOC119373675 n=1 Tax=Rhipicephalus sanguineus TaxID=34632 RepID=UPI0018933058|nr:uncharacterized protein LOC119373675 [Rhipicephalus sanguineus]
MRLLQYSILAGLLICVITYDAYQGNDEGPGVRKRPTQARVPSGRPAARRPAVDKNRGGQDRRRQRCRLKIVQTNCTVTIFLQRWTYNEESNTCDSINFPTCWEKRGVFLTCTACMNTCIKNHKDGPEKSKWIQQHCHKSMTKHLKKHSLN